MADLERGKRIKELRQRKAERLGRRVTQQAMADHARVSLRAAQEWEYGGGSEDDHLPTLLEFLETDSNYLLRGETPDLFAEEDQIGRIERKIDELLRIVKGDEDADDEDAPDVGRPGREPPPISPDPPSRPTEKEGQQRRV